MYTNLYLHVHINLLTQCECELDAPIHENTVPPFSLDILTLLPFP